MVSPSLPYHHPLPSSSTHLAPISIRPRISHTQQARLIMPELEVLIIKAIAIDTERPGPITIEEVPSLRHEAVDDAVEEGPLVAHGLVVYSVLPRAELAEVFGRSVRE